MVKYHVGFNPQNRLHRFPKVFANAFGSRLILWPNGRCAILYPEDADLSRVLSSLRFLARELRDEIESDEKREVGPQEIGATEARERKP